MPLKSPVNVPEVIIRVFFHKVKEPVVSDYCECIYETRSETKRRCKSEWLGSARRLLGEQGIDTYRDESCVVARWPHVFTDREILPPSIEPRGQKGAKYNHFGWCICCDLLGV